MKVTRIGHGSILVEAKGLRILSSLKLPGQEGRHLLKQTMEPYLPCEVLYRPKMGLAVPLALLCSRLTDRGYFSRSYLEHLVVQHDSGGRDYSAPIWTLLMFDAFLRNTMDARESAPVLRVAV